VAGENLRRTRRSWEIALKEGGRVMLRASRSWFRRRRFVFRGRSLRRRERGIVEIEPVENLVVVVARRGRRLVRELHRVSAFKDQNWRIVGRELRVQARIVESVVVV